VNITNSFDMFRVQNKALRTYVHEICPSDDIESAGIEMDWDDSSMLLEFIYHTEFRRVQELALDDIPGRTLKIIYSKLRELQANIMEYNWFTVFIALKELTSQYADYEGHRMVEVTRAYDQEALLGDNEEYILANESDWPVVNYQNDNWVAIRLWIRRMCRGLKKTQRVAFKSALDGNELTTLLLLISKRPEVRNHKFVLVHGTAYLDWTNDPADGEVMFRHHISTFKRDQHKLPMIRNQLAIERLRADIRNPPPADDNDSDASASTSSE